MLVNFGQFIQCSGVLSTTKFSYWKGASTYDTLLCISHTLQSVMESLQEARTVQSDLVLLLTGLTIREFSSSSALWVLEVQCCLY